MVPGETALTRMVGPYSSAAVAVSAITPALAAAYGPSPSAARTPLIEAVLTIRPSPAANMIGTAALRPKNVPIRLTSTMRRNSSGSMSCRPVQSDTPALL